MSENKQQNSVNYDECISRILKFFSNESFVAAYNLDPWSKFDGNFLKYYDYLFGEYEKLLAMDWTIDLPDNNDVLKNKTFQSVVESARDKVDKVGNIVRESICLYLHGAVSQAQIKFREIHQHIPISDDSVQLRAVRHPHLFRVRTTDDMLAIRTRSEMFHVPFSKRSIIGTTRYSIPGYPCLYLSTSLFTCWEEMGCPHFHKIIFSRFTMINNYRIAIYLADTPLAWSEFFQRFVKDRNIDHGDRNLDFFGRFLHLWPLQLACSIPTRCPGSKFQEEYIVPQLLTEFVRETDQIHGIFYRTTKVHQVSENKIAPCLLLNYAFPARNTEEEYCKELAADFHLTEPILYDMAISCHVKRECGYCHPRTNGVIRSTIPLLAFHPNTMNTEEDAYFVPYQYTNFAKAEEYSAYCKMQKHDN